MKRWLHFFILLGGAVLLASEVLSATPPLRPPFLGWQLWPASGGRLLPECTAPAGATNAAIGIVSARGVVATASFALRSTKPFQELALVPTSLRTESGELLSEKALDLRLVKCWYQDANGWFAACRGPGRSVLVPELLVHDDSLVRIDPKSRENLVRTSAAGEPPAYRRIKAARGGAVTPAVAFVAADDAERLLPFPVAAGETRQLHLAIDLPPTVRPGLYHGRIGLVADGTDYGHLELDLRVVDHLLPPPCPRFSGRGDLDGTKVFSGGGAAVVTTDPERFETVASLPRSALSASSIRFLRKSGIGNVVFPPSLLPRWKDFFDGKAPASLWLAESGALSSVPTGGLSVAKAKEIIGLGRKTGARDLRLFLPLDPSGEGLAAALPTLEAVDDAGARAWVFADDETYGVAGALIRSAMRAGYPAAFSRSGPRIRAIGAKEGDAYGEVEYSDTRQGERWHAIGEPYYLCSTLPAGVEDPSVWRRRLGVECFYLGYDGFILPALIEETDPWNDWASPVHRSRTFLYPTKSGFVPTLAWEGLREAVTDVRYLSSLRRLADGVRYAGLGDPRLDIEGRRASMWLDQFPVQKGGLDTMRLDAIAWIVRLEALLGGAGR